MVLRIMSQTEGDSALDVDVADAASVEEARIKFNDMVNGTGRFRAYNVITGPKREGVPIDTFPPTAAEAPEGFAGTVLEDVDELLLVPPLAGG